MLTFLFWLFVVCFLVQMWFALNFFVPVLRQQKYTAPPEPSLPVSLIICAKNEARSLERNLPALLAQRYMNAAGNLLYEVIVVDDASDDHTAEVLRRLAPEYSHLRIVTIGNHETRTLPGKKFALSKGVAAAAHETLLLTDADCSPASEDWISRMTAPLASGAGIVAGYGGYGRQDTLLNGFIRWETVHTFILYAAFARAGRPYMGVGRNLACKRELLMKAQAAEVWRQLPSGDDDLLFRVSATADNTTVVSDPEAHTVSEAKQTWAEWLAQKKRHMSTGKYYRTGIKVLLSLYALSHALLWVLFFGLLGAETAGLVIMLMLMRTTLYWTIWSTTSMRLRERKFFRWIPLCDIGWLVYNFALSPYIIWKNRQQWK